MNLSKKPHTFAWANYDEAGSFQGGHREESDGQVTSGQYRVALPDGRIQVPDCASIFASKQQIPKVAIDNKKTFDGFSSRQRGRVV